MTRFRERDASCFQNKDSCSVQSQGGMEATAFPLNWLEATVSVVSLRERERDRERECDHCRVHGPSRCFVVVGRWAFPVP